MTSVLAALLALAFSGPVPDEPPKHVCDPGDEVLFSCRLEDDDSLLSVCGSSSGNTPVRVVSGTSAQKRQELSGARFSSPSNPHLRLDITLFEQWDADLARLTWFDAPLRVMLFAERLEKTTMLPSSLDTIAADGTRVRTRRCNALVPSRLRELVDHIPSRISRTGQLPTTSAHLDAFALDDADLQRRAAHGDRGQVAFGCEPADQDRGLLVHATLAGKSVGACRAYSSKVAADRGGTSACDVFADCGELHFKQRVKFPRSRKDVVMTERDAALRFDTAPREEGTYADLCNESDVVLASCTTDGGEVVSVCADPSMKSVARVVEGPSRSKPTSITTVRDGSERNIRFKLESRGTSASHFDHTLQIIRDSSVFQLESFSFSGRQLFSITRAQVGRTPRGEGCSAQSPDLLDLLSGTVTEERNKWRAAPSTSAHLEEVYESPTEEDPRLPAPYPAARRLGFPPGCEIEGNGAAVVEVFHEGKPIHDCRITIGPFDREFAPVVALHSPTGRCGIVAYCAPDLLFTRKLKLTEGLQYVRLTDKDRVMPVDFESH